MKLWKRACCLTAVWCVLLGAAIAQDAATNDSNANQQNTNQQTVAPPNANRSRTNQVEQIDYEVELTVLATGATGERLPAQFEAITKQLRDAYPMRNYRVATKFMQRVSNNSMLEVKGIAGAIFNVTGSPNPPSFYEFRTGRVTRTETGGIRFEVFRFGTRVPITTATSKAGEGFPVINYEPIGLTATFSVRPNMPTMFGTITTQREDELLALVITVREVR